MLAGDDLLQARDDPTVLNRRVGANRRLQADLVANVQQYEPRSIEELVRQRLALLDAFA